jgi:hypothetical protein
MDVAARGVQARFRRAVAVARGGITAAISGLRAAMVA